VLLFRDLHNNQLIIHKYVAAIVEARRRDEVLEGNSYVKPVRFLQSKVLVRLIIFNPSWRLPQNPAKVLKVWPSGSAASTLHLSTLPRMLYLILPLAHDRLSLKHCMSLPYDQNTWLPSARRLRIWLKRKDGLNPLFQSFESLILLSKNPFE
jgi:hypothetical protein